METLKCVPEIYWNSNDNLKFMPRPRILKSHEYCDPRYPKVIYIVRDVRSVILSYYKLSIQADTVSPQTTYADFTRSFLCGELDGYGSWQDNVRSWKCNRGYDAEFFCLIRYEDLHDNGINTLRKMANFIGLNCTDF